MLHSASQPLTNFFPSGPRPKPSHLPARCLIISRPNSARTPQIRLPLSKMARPPHPSRLPQVLLPPLRQPFPQPNRNSSNGLAEERPCLSLSFCWAFSIWSQRKRKFQREKPNNPQALCAPLGRQPFPRPVANPALQPRRKPNASPTKCGLQKRKPKRKRPPAPRPSEKKRVSRPKRKPRE